MKREDKERMFLSEQSFLEKWITQFDLYTDLDGLNHGFKLMNKRLNWINEQIKLLADEPAGEVGEETKCMHCKHISVKAEWNDGKFVRNIFYCDKKQVTESNKLIQKDNCDKYEEHFNQRILGEYLLAQRVDKGFSKQDKEHSDCNHVVGAADESGCCIKCGKKVCEIINNNLCQK